MRLAIVSDVHGNRTALEAVEADLRRESPDLILQGGDLAYGGSSPAAVVDRIRELGWPGIHGNTDEVLWAPETVDDLARLNPQQGPLWQVVSTIAAHTRELLGDERIRWLRSLPGEHRSDGVTLVHASPGDLWHAPSPTASDEELSSVYGPLASPLVVYGHIHQPFVRHCSHQIVANSGSVSLSYDGDPRASYLLIEDHVLSLRRVEYDVESEVKELMSSSFPRAEWIAATLRKAGFVPLGAVSG